MSSHVCEAFKDVENHLPDNYSFDRSKVSTAIRTYCQTNNKAWKGECYTIGQVVSAVTMLLLNKLFVANKNIESENKNNEYITYVMLWLSNKMKLIKTGRYGSVADFYVTFIKNNKIYIIYRDKIDKNRKIMNLNIDRMRTLYGLLNNLCNAITKYNNGSSNYSDFSNFVNNWIIQYIQLLLKKPKVFEDEYYCDVLVTLKNAYEKFKKDNDTKSCFPEIIEIEKIKTCEELGKEAKSSSKVIKVEFNEVKGEQNLEKGKDTSIYIDVIKRAFETCSSNFSITFTNISNNLYEKLLPPITDFYEKIINLGDKTINYVNEYFKNPIETYTLDNCILDPQATRNESPSNDLPSPQDSGIKVAESGTTEIGDNPLNLYKKMGISILIILIPIALAIMYKYLPFGWRKKSKKKKNMKKAINMFDTNETTEEVINPTDRKKQMKITINLSSQNKQDKKLTNSSTPKKQDKQFINSSTPKKQDKQFINSNDRKKKVEIIINSSKKKQTKDFINSTYWGKYPLLNIYKLMKADPVPFIILFLLFIFYLYKRKGDSLE
ncbi:PIR protein [Plasmodium yoelii]|uniref:PIR protein n=2 Tax=Plasmodium yoelii TaxID=5861 RepID=A0AAE9WV81_PLAYO|nr:PIR protein [Plasmodium yoelii]WBY59616.1 PIR protein [Plasmodium yoelii yoelii]VTZ80358.1 PIR protein [Plasmodium yoelii]|eukprot:XP_034493600.1 PIR protein [Plasmodium yoelii]